MEAPSTHPHQFWETLGCKVQLLFSGRYNRLKYFWTLSLVAVPLVVCVQLLLPADFAGEWTGTVLEIAPKAIAWPILVKRLHDLNWPGLAGLLFFIPFIGLILGLILLFKKGTQGPNQYGADPLARAARPQAQTEESQ
jgi:uncharacterized membrane protein YhaH (DUF805 family)